jgi:hypothetical protein
MVRRRRKQTMAIYDDAIPFAPYPVDPALAPVAPIVPAPAPVAAPTGILNRIGILMRDPAIRATMSNIGANMMGQPGASPRVDAFHALNKIVQGTGLGQTMNQATVGGAKPVAPVVGAAPEAPRAPTNVEKLAQEDHPNYKAAKSGINSMIDVLYNTPPPTTGQALQNPPQASTEQGSATPVDAVAPVAPAVMPETGGIPMSTITNLLATGSQPTRADMFEGYTPDPMMIGNIVAGLGTDAAMKPYEMMINTEKARSAMRTGDINAVKAAADMIQAQSDVPYKRAQAAKHMSDVEETNWKMSDNYIKYQYKLELAKKTGEKDAEHNAWIELVKDAEKIPVLDPILKQQGWQNHGQIMRAAGTKDSAIMSSAISAYAKMVGDNRLAGATEKAALTTVLASVTAEINHLSTLKDPATLTPEVRAQGQRLEALGKKTFLTPEDSFRLKQLTSISNIAMTALGAKGGIDIGGSPVPAPASTTPDVMNKVKTDLETQFKGSKVTDVTVSEDTVSFKVDGKGKVGKLQKSAAPAKPAPAKPDTKLKKESSELKRPPGISPREWAGMSTKEQEDYLAERVSNRRDRNRGTSTKVIDRNYI